MNWNKNWYTVQEPLFFWREFTVNTEDNFGETMSIIEFVVFSADTWEYSLKCIYIYMKKLYVYVCMPLKINIPRYISSFFKYCISFIFFYIVTFKKSSKTFSLCESYLYFYAFSNKTIWQLWRSAYKSFYYFSVWFKTFYLRLPLFKGINCYFKN